MGRDKIAASVRSGRCADAIVVVAACLLGACGGDHASAGGSGRSGASGGTDNGGTSGNAGGASGGAGSGMPSGGTGSGADAGESAGAGSDPSDCGGDSYTAGGKTLEMYVLFDDSGSWIYNMWPAAQMAFNGFVSDPASAGISVALKWYGESCDPTAYATPDVPLGPLPLNAAALTSAVTARSPMENTTTEPALLGGLQWATMRYATGLNIQVVMLLITDGSPDPADCTGSMYRNDIVDVANAASMGFMGNPSVPTYVLALGDQVGNLDQIAAAGGTMKAISGAPGILTMELNKIREMELAALPCEYDMPAEFGMSVKDPDKVNLNFNGMPVPRVDSMAACVTAPDMNGWYYDNPKTPARIIACDATCGMLKTPGGSVDINLGCPTDLGK